MLEPEYAKLEDIPAEKRGAYKKDESTGKYVLDDLSPSHPLVAHKLTLERDLSSERGKVTKLSNEKATLEARPALADGQVAVPAAEKAYIEKLKPLGDPDAIWEMSRKSWAGSPALSSSSRTCPRLRSEISQRMGSR
jgi:hypothetical protein